MTSSELYCILKGQWPGLKLITELSIGNLKVVDDNYDLVPEDVVGTCKKSLFAKIFDKPVAMDRNDCDDRAMRCMQRVRDTHTGKFTRAIGYATGRFTASPNETHAVNVCITKSGIALYDDETEKAWRPDREDRVWFIFI